MKSIACLAPLVVLFMNFVVVAGDATSLHRDTPSHYCAAACVGPCFRGEPCDCDGRTCPMDVNVPGKGLVRVKVENEGLPRRRAACADRPLSKGRTFRRDPAHMDYYAWVCNDSECVFHAGSNTDFRGR